MTTLDLQTADSSRAQLEGRRNRRPLLSLVVPMLNEAANVDRLLDETRRAVANLPIDVETVCVDDGSTDATVETLRRAQASDRSIRVVRLSRNYGKELAVTAGLDTARGDIVVVIDADLQHNPALIADLIAKWREGFDIVYAQRRSRPDQGPVRSWLSRLYYKVFNWIVDVRIPPNAGDFRLLDRKVVDALRQFPESNRFMKGLFAFVGFRSTGIEFDVRDRAAGQTSWSFWRLWNFALDGITSFSTVPLRVWTYVGAAVAAISFVSALWLIASTFAFGRDVPGYATIVVLVLFFGGLQLITLGILGEYLGRVFTEVKRRPLYLVDSDDDKEWRKQQPGPERDGTAARPVER